MGHATCFQQHLSGGIKMASYKDYKTVAAAKKAGSLYFMGKDGKKKLAVTAETLKTWKKKNKGKFKGSALTAWANNKGKDIKGVLRPKARPSSKKPQGPTRRGSMTLDEKREVDQANADNDAEERRLGGQKDQAVIIAERALRELDAEEADYKKNLKREGATAETFKQRKKLEEMKKSRMNKGGMMKKKGYAKGGMMKKKGYAKGGKVMSYNLGGMIKSQTNHMKKGR